MAGSLRTLARLRKLELTMARGDLALAMEQEIEAKFALQAAQEAPGNEAARLSGSELGLEAAGFAAWLPRAEAAIDRQSAKFQDASEARLQASEMARQAHAAREAVSAICMAREQEARLKAARKRQLELDELGRRKRP